MRRVIPVLAIVCLASAASAQTMNVPERTAGDGTTPLHWASYRDNLAEADRLIRAGANINAANDLGATPLWIASMNGSAAMVERLLAAGANPKLALVAGETPLMAAAQSGNARVAETLLAKGADPNAHGPRGQTALMWAAAERHPDVVKVLLAHGADVHARSETWSQVMAVPPHGMLEYNRAIPHGNNTALMFAARVGDLASAKLLVAAGANVNDQDAWSVSATTMAAHAGYREVVEFLLDRGANPNSDASAFTALHAAVMRRDQQMAAALLSHGADANARVRAWTPTRRSSKDYNFPPELVGATPLWLAARYTQPEMMRLLVRHGADPLFVHRVEYHEGEGAVPRKHATTAVMAAVGIGGGGAGWMPVARADRERLMLETVKLAVELGVDPNAKNIDGKTALDAATTAKLASVVAFLTTSQR